MFNPPSWPGQHLAGVELGERAPELHPGGFPERLFWPQARVNWRTDARRATEVGIAVCGAAVRHE